MKKTTEELMEILKQKKSIHAYFINPCALNLSQWFELIRRSCSMAKEAMRDRTAETVMENRDVIQKNWDLLLSETGLTEV